MLALNTTDMLKKLTKSECLETSYRAYKYSTSKQWKRRRRRRSSWRTTSNLNDCNNNNYDNKSSNDLSERKPKAVKQIIPWKSVKEKNPHDTSDCLRLRKFSWFRDLCFQLEEIRDRGRERGRGYALSFAQDKFNERTPATDLSDTLHCRPVSPSDKLQFQIQFSQVSNHSIRKRRPSLCLKSFVLDLCKYALHLWSLLVIAKKLRASCQNITLNVSFRYFPSDRRSCTDMSVARGGQRGV